MKTKEQIKEKLEIYKKIKKQSAIFTTEFSLSLGAVTALEWVLEEEQWNRCRHAKPPSSYGRSA